MNISYRALAASAIIALSPFSIGASAERIDTVFQAETVDGPFENLLVVAIYSDSNARRSFEVALAEALRKAGTAASYSLQFIRSIDEVDRDTLVRIAAEANADGVLISRPIAFDRQDDLSRSRTPVTAVQRYSVPLADFFSYDFSEYRDPLVLSVVTSVQIETDLYRVADETRIWRVQSRAKEKASLLEIVNDHAKALTKAMRRADLID